MSGPNVSRADARMIAEAASDLAAKALAYRARAERLEAAAADALAGWRYIRAQHGDLYGVGWDRVEQALVDAIGSDRHAA